MDTQISNQAGIYFDRNEVVFTNTTLNTLYENPAAVADFTTKHECSSTGLAYDFTYTGNTADNSTFLWNFGNDAVPATSAEQNPEGILFNTIGTKQVSLTVSKDGCSSSITKSVEIINVLTGKKKDKVIICHNGKSIEVNLNALPAHIAHGDCIGLCNSSSSKIVNTQNNSDNNETIFTAFPNPLKDDTAISFSVNETRLTSLEIYNYLGKKIATLFNQPANEGQVYNIDYDTNDIQSGIYFCVLKANLVQQLIKLVIIK